MTEQVIFRALSALTGAYAQETARALLFDALLRRIKF
jgi:hypothetical protein